MKICLIMGGGEEGGLENHVIDVANALAVRHEIHCIAHPKYTGRLTNVNFHPVDLTLGRRNPVLLYKVIRIIRQLSLDILHVHGNKATTIVAGIQRFLPDNLRYVATLHNMKRNLKAYDRFNALIGVSARIMKGLEHPCKYVIHNGVHIAPERLKSRDYLLEQTGLDTDYLLIVSVARLVSVKRVDVLLEAFKGIKKAQLVLIGDGRERDMLTHLCNKLDLVNVHFLGHRSDNIELLSAADLCVISSEKEGFPYVMVESLLVGTPVISTDVSDMKEILPDRAVVAVNDVAGLHQLMGKVSNDYEAFSRAYLPTLKWASEHLNFEKMLEKTEQVYQAIQ